jgi:hypothetical protein
MRDLGSEIWTSQWRGNQSLGNLNRVEFWDVNYEQARPIQQVIKPGDRLNTHCIYDSYTPQKGTATAFGVYELQEMCIHSILYYPAMNFFYCGYYKGLTLCGRNTTNDLLNLVCDEHICSYI